MFSNVVTLASTPEEWSAAIEAELRPSGDVAKRRAMRQKTAKTARLECAGSKGSEDHGWVLGV